MSGKIPRQNQKAVPAADAAGAAFCVYGSVSLTISLGGKRYVLKAEKG